MEDFKKRLVEFARARYDMGHTRFEDYCGVTHGTLSAIKSSGPSASVVTRIAVACPELNLNWLFRGEGEMILGEAPVPHKKESSPSVNMENVQAVFISNWNDIRGVVEEAVKSALKNS